MTISRRKFLTMAAAAPLVARLPASKPAAISGTAISGTWMTIDECVATWAPALPAQVYMAWNHKERAWQHWLAGVERWGR